MLNNITLSSLDPVKTYLLSLLMATDVTGRECPDYCVTNSHEINVIMKYSLEILSLPPVTN